MRRMLPVLLKRLSKIPDPRNPKKTKHKLTVLMLYGLLAFVDGSLPASARGEVGTDFGPFFATAMAVILGSRRTAR